MIRYRADIDGLRAVAIVTVVACHSGLPGWAGGFVGVDVFFVISGFLITSLLVDEAERTGRVDLWSFYARRVRRLLPALLAVLVATLVLGAAFLIRLNGEQQGLARSAIATLLLNANHYFLLDSGGYFERPSELLPLLHIWSLSLEEQFYLVWPPCLAALLATRRWTDFRPKVARILAAVFVATLAASWWVTKRSPSAAFYLMPLRAWELAAGGLLALVPLAPQSALRRHLGAILAVLGAGGIVAAVSLYDEKTPFPGLAASVPVLGTAAIIAGNALAPAGPITRLLSLGPVVSVGLVSYSWYLWHWPLLATARSAALGERDLVRDVALAGVAGLALAYATYFTIEKPVRTSRALKSRGSKTTVRYGAVATLVGLIAAGSLGGWAKFSSRTPDELRLIHAQKDFSSARAVCNNDLGTIPSLPRLEDCVRPAAAGQVDVVLWGDSLADHWAPALTEAASSLGLSVYQLTGDACPPLLGAVITHRLPEEPRNCTVFQRLVQTEIERLRAENGLRTVVLSAWWESLDNVSMAPMLERTLDWLESLGLRVVVIEPTPKLAYHAPDCLAQREATSCGIARESFEAQRHAAKLAIETVVAGKNASRIVDPAPYLCDDRRCPVTKGDLVLYRDHGHLTAEASRSLSELGRVALSWKQ